MSKIAQLYHANACPEGIAHLLDVLGHEDLAIEVRDCEDSEEHLGGEIEIDYERVAQYLDDGGLDRIKEDRFNVAFLLVNCTYQKLETFLKENGVKCNNWKSYTRAYYMDSFITGLEFTMLFIDVALHESNATLKERLKRIKDLV